MKRSVALILCMIIIVSGCSWPFGEALKTVAFTVLETAGGEFGAAVPEANIVNIGEQAIDVIISGEALRNGPFPLSVNKVRADRNEILIFLDWETGSEVLNQSVQKLIRLEKGEWWQSDQPPRIRLLNANGGSLNASSSPQDVRQAVYGQLPELTNENIYLNFSLDDVTSSNPSGVWDVTVAGSPEESEGQILDIVAKLKVSDENLEIISGKITYHSPDNGTIVKVEEL